MKSKLFLTLVLALGVLPSTGCRSSYQFGLTNQGQDFKQGATGFTNQLDILWVVDNSNSMAPLQANMASNFNSFISNFQSKKYDFRMAVTTTDAYKANPSFVQYSAANAPLSLFQDGAPGATPSGVFVIIPTTLNLDSTFVTNATTGIVGSGDERAFSSMMTAMTNPRNPSFLRSSSFFAIIILSDEDDFSLYGRTEGSWGSNAALDHCYVDPTMDGIASTAYGTAAHTSTCANQTPPDNINSYIQDLDSLTTSTGTTRRYNVSAITVLDSACQLQHAADTAVTVIGQRYIQMSQATNGVTGSICDASYAQSLSNIAQQIAVLSTQFFLNIVPNPSTITVMVNGVPVANDGMNGWTYNSTANSIQFHGNATPPQGADISVNFLPLAARS